MRNVNVNELQNQQSCQTSVSRSVFYFLFLENRLTYHVMSLSDNREQGID